MMNDRLQRGRVSSRPITRQAQPAGVFALEPRCLMSASVSDSDGMANAAKSAALLPTNAKAATPTPVISAMTTSLHVGQALFVNALSGKLGVGTADTAHFVWDFGDPTSKYNSLVGFNASHAYDKAGTYTVTLKVWNQSYGYKSTSIKVNVASAGRTVYYVSASGSDSNSGTSSSRPFKTFAKAASKVKTTNNVEVLFKDGDTFSVTKGMVVGGDNVRLGSYGTGKAPVFRWDGPLTTQDIVRVDGAASGTVIQGITFDSKYTGPNESRGGMPFAIHDFGPRTAIRDVTFMNVGYDINANGSPTGLLVQDSSSPTQYGLHDYFLWAQGSDIVALGNTVANSTNEHPIRVYGVNRMLLAYNDLKNPQTYSFETSKTALNIQKGNDIYVWHNTIRGPRMQVGPLGGTDGTGDKGARLNDIVVEDNTILDTQVEVDHGINNAYFRNNVFKFNGTIAFDVQGYSNTYKRGVVNLDIANNTFVNSGKTGRVFYLEGNATDISLVNNLYRADNMFVGSYGTAAVYVNDKTLHSFDTISNNVWPSPSVSTYFKKNVPGGTGFAFVGTDVNSTSSYYNLSRWNALSQVGTDKQADVVLSSLYKPTSQSSTVATAIREWPGVFGDYSGADRTLTETWTVGAVQV